ncbi:hypothetical protein Pryu01_01246 [Paraliobacillus ryukyuensis]|uniref:Uncharacterized protein n=1 Tax=Paraliobacillus ryukyuensis TaxID=200904 RepID=A0A366EAR6_9BACI|nr:hypothetical protein [Paraliobacillus ryukyuensis]RBO99520.1 hypothetical protein DES48_104196 [Paraliobacillus ryukyuensis]
MNINLLNTIITTVAAIFTIIQITKEFIKPKTSILVQQKFVNGDDIYIDASTTINKPPYHNNNDDGFETAALRVGLAFLIISIILSFYSLTYEFISMIGLLILSITIYKDTKIPFENHKAKIQWAFKNITYIAIIFSLLFIPKSVEAVIVQIQPMQFDSLQTLLNSITYNIKFVWNLLYNDTLTANNVIGRVLVNLGIIYYFTVLLITKRKVHNERSLKDMSTFILVMILIIIVSNIDSFWNLIEPLRDNIETWFNSTN